MSTFENTMEKKLLYEEAKKAYDHALRDELKANPHTMGKLITEMRATNNTPEAEAHWERMRRIRTEDDLDKARERIKLLENLLGDSLFQKEKVG